MVINFLEPHQCGLYLKQQDYILDSQQLLMSMKELIHQMFSKSVKHIKLDILLIQIELL